MEELKRLRKAKGLSQAKLAALADLDPSTVSQIETGARRANTRTLERLAVVLGTEVANLFPKAQAPPSPEQPSFNGLLEEERRLHYLKPWAGYINALANRVEREIDQGHVTDHNWAQEFNKDVLTLTFLYERILPLPEEQTEDERLELLKLSEAIDKLHEVADKMHDAMEPIIAEMHKEMYAKEREQRKAALGVIHGRLSA